MTPHEKVLRILLQVAGILMLPAWLAVVMPTSWMDATHGWLGLGELPEGPIVEYLARSLSLLYGVHAGLLLLAARDVRRYLPVIVYLSVLGVVSGVVFFAVDLYAGMPARWTWGEGPMVIALSLVLLYLTRSVAAPYPTG